MQVNKWFVSLAVVAWTALNALGLIQRWYCPLPAGLQQAGGPSPQAIRNQGGADYRALIEAYAVSYGTTRKKTLAKGARNMVPNRDEDILSRIDDPAIRAVIGAIIRERNQYRN